MQSNLIKTVSKSTKRLLLKIHFDFDFAEWPNYLHRKNNLIFIMTPEKQDKTLELSKHWSVDSTPARNEVIMKRTYPVKSVKCNKMCSNC